MTKPSGAIKPCVSCGTLFAVGSPREGGRYKYCSERCKRREWNKRTRDYRSAWMSDARYHGYDSLREWVRKMKAIEYLGGCCADCGYATDLRAFEFDHVRGKSGSIHQFLRYTWAKLKAELDKCDLVCGSCHNIRTEIRRAASAA